MALLLRPVTKMKCSMPAALASSTTCWISGRSTTVSISLGIALLAGRKRVPSPATGNTALRTGAAIQILGRLTPLFGAAALFPTAGVELQQRLLQAFQRKALTLPFRRQKPSPQSAASAESR